MAVFGAERPGGRDRGHRVMVWLYVAACAACCLVGGTSKASAPQYLLLWPVLAAIVAVQLCRYDIGGLVRHSRVLWLLAALAAVVAAGLVPLPQGLWLSLPGRDRYASAFAGEGGWATLSLTPDNTINSLLMMVPPLIAIVAVARVAPRRVVAAIIVAGLASALLGLAQMAAGAGSAFSMYRDYDHDLPIGWFTNRNHQATFLASILPLLALVHARADLYAPARWGRATVSLAMAGIGLVLVAVILATGSRSGAIQLGIAILACLAIAVRLPRRGAGMASLWSGRNAAVAGVVVAAGALVAALLARSAAFDRLSTFRVVDDQRFRNLDAVRSAIFALFPTGSGFGSFDPVFRGFERDEVLRRTFFNNAHNDLLELVMTGGLPAALVLAAFLAWFAARAGGNLLRAVRRGQLDRGVAALSASVVVVLVASLTDYPLRTPLIAFAFASYCALIEGLGRSGARAP